MEVENLEERKKHHVYPREEDIVTHNGDILDALEKLRHGEAVFVCSRKLSILIRRFGEPAYVKSLRWRGKFIFRVQPANEN
ncbi:MAG: hypothetical protein Q6352_003970 [Candidatus Freyrarchaeum guaymaensis]|nr:hypothetical protein [Candidatus Sigynarchaeota archaeon]